MKMLIIMGIPVKPKKWQTDALCKGTPVARRWADTRMKAGEKFENFEEDYLDVLSVEDRLYTQMKETLIHHITLHGLDKQSDLLFDEFKAIRYYNRHVYEKLLKKIRVAFVKDEKNRNYEYLISKIMEYINKVTALNETIYQMLLDGKQPDLDSWSDKAALQDALFEENKQFLKQTLNHLNALKKSKCKLGIAEVKLLLYNKQGCLREKLYREVERWIIEIYNSLTDPTEQLNIYKEVCSFVAEIVPKVGYISPGMIRFIFDRGYLSHLSYNLLLGIYNTIRRLGMNPLFEKPLSDLLVTAEQNLAANKLTESDTYVIEIAKLYAPKIIPPKILMQYQNATLLSER